MKILSDKIVTTRKAHKCNACGRLFNKGTRMKTQTYVDEVIYAWRECPTCQTLLENYGYHFVDPVEDVFDQYCIRDALRHGQTPEGLLADLNSGKAW